MVIANSSVAMSAASYYNKTTTLKKQTATTYHEGNTENTAITSSESTTVDQKMQGSVSLMQSFKLGNALKNENKDGFENALQTEETENKSKLGEKKQAFASASELVNNLNTTLGTLNSSNPKLQALQKMLELLQQMREKSFSKMLNRKDVRSAAQGLNFEMKLSSSNATAIRMISSSSESSNSGARGYWTKQDTMSGNVSTTEAMAFQSTGVAKTADGREINFGVTLEMSHSFAASYLSVSEEREFTPTDPLVINLGAQTAGVSDMTFRFDLNCDGKKEEISSLEKGSAFLALDKNKDGKINDGGELFGAKTGDGFAELAAYDEDGNGWIDEADSVFSSLSVWTKNADGKDELLAISKAGVGAIYLGSAKADYNVRNGANEKAAQIRSSGVFLREDGTAGTIQHVDFFA